MSSKRNKTMRYIRAQVPQNIIFHALACHAEEGHKEEGRLYKHGSLAAKSEEGCGKVWGMVDRKQ